MGVRLLLHECAQSVPIDLMAVAYDMMSRNLEQKAIFDELKQLIDTGNPDGKYFFR